MTSFLFQRMIKTAQNRAEAENKFKHYKRITQV